MLTAEGRTDGQTAYGKAPAAVAARQAPSHSPASPSPAASAKTSASAARPSPWTRPSATPRPCSPTPPSKPSARTFQGIERHADARQSGDPQQATFSQPRSPERRQTRRPSTDCLDNRRSFWSHTLIPGADPP
ncbi:hypothetical protein [Thiohalocapsa halophila]|uniref:hypothetical protein n=1 Tax=Thiohalocapsa halophila TaxID=69359 RepID=UPI0034DAC5DD